MRWVLVPHDSQGAAWQYKLHRHAIAHDIDNDISLCLCLHDAPCNVHHAEHPFAIVANDLIAGLYAGPLRRGVGNHIADSDGRRSAVCIQITLIVSISQFGSNSAVLRKSPAKETLLTAALHGFVTRLQALHLNLCLAVYNPLRLDRKSVV